MAFGQGSWVSAPRRVTLLVSLVLVGLAVAALTRHLPVQLALARSHPVGLAVAGYAVLLAGVLVRRL